ncbi:MAG: hypothetical protein QNL04_14620 [SAR324 cluster bacterium]|nr:hypothetical protein [SAR324 cluster bacterium]
MDINELLNAETPDKKKRNQEDFDKPRTTEEFENWISCDNSETPIDEVEVIILDNL